MLNYKQARKVLESGLMWMEGLGDRKIPKISSDVDWFKIEKRVANRLFHTLEMEVDMSRRRPRWTMP